jgi:Holliday junction resolvase RusA-like endonuclease
MTSLAFQIPLAPFSLNQSHRLVKFGKRASRIKTSEFIEWEKDFSSFLGDYSDIKQHLLEKYNDAHHGFMLEIFLYINSDSFFSKPKTKKDHKRISKRSKDVSNCVKTSEDQIFRWLGIDDSQVTKIIAEKIPTNSESTMVFRISLVKFPELFVVQPEQV